MKNTEIQIQEEKNKKKNKLSNIGVLIGINLKLGLRGKGIIATGVIFIAITLLLPLISLSFADEIADILPMMYIQLLLSTFFLSVFSTMIIQFYYRKQITEGIHNIELRGGINSLISFWIRFLCQKVIAWIYLLIAIILSSIILSTIKELDGLSKLYLVGTQFLFLLIELFISSLILFVFTFAKTANGIILSVFVGLVAAFAPFTAMITFLTSFSNDKYSLGRAEMQKLSIAAYEGKEIRNFIVSDKNLNNAFSNPEFIFNKLDITSLKGFYDQGSQDQDTYKNNNADIIFQGLVYDGPADYIEEKDPNEEDYRFEPYSPTIIQENSKWTLNKDPFLKGTKLYDDIFEPIFKNSVGQGYISNYSGSEDIIFNPYYSRGWGSQKLTEDSRVKTKNLVSYLKSNLDAVKNEYLIKLLDYIVKKEKLFEKFTSDSFDSGIGWSGESFIMPFKKYGYGSYESRYGYNDNFYTQYPDLILLNYYIMAMWKLSSFLDVASFIPDAQRRNDVVTKIDKEYELNNFYRKSKSSALNPFMNFYRINLFVSEKNRLYVDSSLNPSYMLPKYPMSITNFDLNNEYMAQAIKVRDIEYYESNGSGESDKDKNDPEFIKMIEMGNIYDNYTPKTKTYFSQAGAIFAYIFISSGICWLGFVIYKKNSKI